MVYGDYLNFLFPLLFFFSSRRRHTRFKCDWSSDVCSSDLKGQLLFEIDPRPFQAALDQAEGQLAQAKAALANAQAVQGRTELDVNRYAPLAKEQAASQQDLDKDRKSTRLNSSHT